MELDKNIISWRFFMVPFRQGLLSMSYKKEREEAFVCDTGDHCHHSEDRVSVIIFKLLKINGKAQEKYFFSLSITWFCLDVWFLSWV